MFTPLDLHHWFLASLKEEVQHFSTSDEKKYMVNFFRHRNYNPAKYNGQWERPSHRLQNPCMFKTIERS